MKNLARYEKTVPYNTQGGMIQRRHVCYQPHPPVVVAEPSFCIVARPARPLINIFLQKLRKPAWNTHVYGTCEMEDTLGPPLGCASISPVFDFVKAARALEKVLERGKGKGKQVEKAKGRASWPKTMRRKKDQDEDAMMKEALKKARRARDQLASAQNDLEEPRVGPPHSARNWRS